MYQERISRVLAAMERMGLEQMLVSDPDSIWYLTGYDVFPFERLYAFYLRKDGQHKLFLNKLFPVPEAPYEQVWFSDTDDYLAILANAVDGEKDMGVDKDWPARFLLPLMAHNPSVTLYGSYTSAQLAKLAEVTDKVKESIMSVYRDRLGKPDDEI